MELNPGEVENAEPGIKPATFLPTGISKYSCIFFAIVKFSLLWPLGKNAHHVLGKLPYRYHRLWEEDSLTGVVAEL